MTPEEIQQIFFVECEESLAAAEAGLAACRDGTQDADTVNGVFRAVHSIKGGAGAFGFAALQAYTHCFETLLSDVREGLVPLDEPLVDLLLRALDTLSDHVSAARDGSPPPADDALLAELTAAQAGNGHAHGGEPEPGFSATLGETAASETTAGDDDMGLGLDAMLDDLLGPSPAAPAAPPAERWTLRIRPSGAAMDNGGEPLTILRELAAMGATCSDCDTSRVPSPDGFDVGCGYLEWTLSVPGEVSHDSVRELFDFNASEYALGFGDQPLPPPEEKAQAKAAPQPVAQGGEAPAPAAPAPASREAPAAAAPASQSIRIDLVKLDRLIDSVGELVIAQAMLAQRLTSENLAASEELTMLETLTRDIQESAMSIRAQPIGSVFSRVPRILRELASSTGKHVRLDVIGETTELDKTVIERLGEPLTHLIRNAVDHGIESTQDRLAAGKPAEGTLTLSAEQRSGRIVIRITDDGKGIDRERVLAKAVEKGLVAADAQLSREDIDNLIFAPGFSTAAQVSSVSGRGVGMDVVRQNVKELGGRISIESEQGRGTSFVLTLPLTLAISDGMIVRVGSQTLVVPLAHVVESLRPGPGDVQGMGAARRMLNVRGRFIPVIPVGSAIGEADCCSRPEDGVLIVVDSEIAGQAALLVDGISDQRQFVIKSLDANYRSVEGVAGATILGDGRVALILDIDGLVAASLGTGHRLAA